MASADMMQTDTVDPIVTEASYRAFFLARLTRLVHQEAEWSDRVGRDDWRIHLIRRAIYSSYYDCVALGLTDDARELMHGNRLESDASVH